METASEGRWLQCNGVAVSRTTYSLLFDYLNALTPALPFGSGDGTTTFTLPDMRGRVPVAEGTHTDVDNMGDSDGVALANRSPSHSHTVNRDNQTGFTSYLSRTGQTAIGTERTSGNQSLTDNPAFLVVGSWFIKYV